MVFSPDLSTIMRGAVTHQPADENTPSTTTEFGQTLRYANLRLRATHTVASTAPRPVHHSPETAFRRPGESLGNALWRHLNDLL